MRKVLYLFAILEESDIDWLLRVGRRRDVSQGTVLITEGHRTDSMFFVLDGEFSVTVGGMKGREVARLAAGEILGEMSFVDSRPPSASVTALRDSSLLAVPLPQLAEKLEDDPRFAARFYKALAFLLAQRLRTTTSTLGYGSNELHLEEEVEDQDELSSDLLDTVSLAGMRFAELQKRVRSAAT